MSEPGPDAPSDGPAAAAVAAGEPPEEPDSAGAGLPASGLTATADSDAVASGSAQAGSKQVPSSDIASNHADPAPGSTEPPPPANAAFAHRAAPPAPLAPLLGAFAIDLLLALALLAGLSVLGTLGWGFAQGLRGLDGAQAAPGLTATMLIALSATAISALAVYYFRRNANAVERAASWRALWRPSSWGWIAIAPIVLVTCSTLIVAAAQAQGLDVTPTNQILGPAIRAQPALWLTFAVLIAPAYEELLFRRVLFGRLWAAGRPWLGLVLSSVAFALVHEPPGLGAGRGAGVLVLWTVYTLMGAVFAWIYRRSGSLWVPYLAHAGNNLLATLPLLAAG
ncbi:CPBP family intramembrane glutamic endopeptidase [Lysobacter yananisis]|uniref:CPBP family intramembrane glutamic endopeptidase n=1 Tax=Lysobacter yananisis TaxID=1003114 RepID=A0ABY9PET0_9GAMM|nr:CPBP family intramembrane glutamic endopeptidase [Lysobacter yananisis]WMT04555.1 CPBP family intramembrane glutamic endopeptidase [Lysobacter yananisis]